MPQSPYQRIEPDSVICEGVQRPADLGLHEKTAGLNRHFRNFKTARKNPMGRYGIMASFDFGLGRFLSLLILFFGFTSAPAVAKNAVNLEGAKPNPRISLTPEEQAWLQENPHIRLATLTNQPPFSMMDADGSHTGILADILERLSAAIGQKIEPELAEQAISDTHEVAKQDGIYGSASILKTSRHANAYLLTDAFMTTPFYIYTTTENRSDIRRPADLNGKRVAVPRNHRAVAGYLAEIGGVQTLLADTPLEQMRMVVSGQADALIGYFTYPYLVNKYLMVDLVIALIAESGRGLHIGVNPEHAVLQGILNKAIATLDELTTNAITAKWTAISKEETHGIELTSEEQAWLKDHPDLTFGFTSSFEPFLIRGANGQHTGILVDLLKELNTQLGTQFALDVDSWPVILEKVKNKELGAVLGVASHTADAMGLLKTIPYTTVYPAFFAREDAPFDIKRLDDIRGKSIAILDQAKVMESVLEPFGPDVNILRYPDNRTPLQMVFDGKADLAFGLSIHAYYINKLGLVGVKPVHTLLERPSKVGMAVRTDWPELVSILNKWLTRFSEQEIDTIIGRWMDIPAREKAIELTQEERAWLDKKYTVRVRVSDAPPWEINTPEPQGMSVDYLARIGNKFGIDFKFLPAKEAWIDGFNDVAGEQIHYDLLPAAKRTEERLQHIAMSEDYLESPWVVFSREDVSGIYEIEDLLNKKVAVELGYVMQNKLATTLPEIDLIVRDSTEDALLSLSTKQADAYVGNLIVTSYIIERLGLTNIKVACPTLFGVHSQAMATRKEWAPLISIINKGLSSMPASEKIAIRNKYSAITYEHGITAENVRKWVLISTVSFGGFFLIFLIWNKQLRREVSKRTVELSDSETRFRATFEQAAVGVAHVSPDGKFLRLNRKFCGIVGYPHDELLDLTFQDITHPEDLEADLDFLRQVLSGEIENYTMEKRHLCKDGSIVWVNLTVSLVSDKEGKPNYLVSVIKDISTRKEAQGQLAESEAKYRGLVDNSLVGVFTSTTDGRFVFANDAIARMFDFDSVEQMIASGSLVRWNDIKDREQMLEELRKHGSVATFEAETITNTGRHIWVLFSAKQIGNDIIGMVMDITARKHSETKIAEYQKRLKALAYEVTIAEEKERRAIATDLHDYVGQSLALARMQIAALKSSFPGPDLAGKLDDVSGTLLKALEETQTLMLELSAYSMHDTGLSAAISDWLEGEIKRHRIQTEVIDNLPEDLSQSLDPEMRTILFRNVRELVINAVKHARAKKIRIRLEDRNPNLRIIVDDDGVGFNPTGENKEKPAWGGFGLFRIEELMTDIGGNLKIVSGKDKGTTAILSVPFTAKENRR